MGFLGLAFDAGLPNRARQQVRMAADAAAAAAVECRRGAIYIALLRTWSSPMMKTGWKDESGQTLVLGAMVISVLLGFLALALDVGLLFHARTQMQIAADAAATAAALDYKYGVTYTGKTADQSAQQDALAAATQNGMLATGTVTINKPTGYTEAVVSEPYPTIFMRVFRYNSVNVTARAGVGSNATGGCLWTLAKSGTDISLSGNGSLTASGCEIYDDSSATDALSISGNGSVTAKAIGIVGGYSVGHNGSINPDPPTTGIAPAADPLNISAPQASTSTCSGSSCVVSNSGNNNVVLSAGTYTSISNSGNGTMTLQAGNYTITGSLTNSGNGALVLGAGNYTIGGSFSTSGNGNVTIGAGEYIIGGNLSLQGNGSLTGSGVTFFTAGSNTVTGNGNMNLAAPTSGTYSGLLFYQSSNSAVSITGNGGDDLQGILYAPTAAVTLTGNGNLNVSLDIISDSMSIQGNGSTTLTNYAAATNTNSVLSKLVMVE
jgi:Flp pilus assembly protein TadG